MENKKEIFGKKNYQIMFVGLAFIIVGFVLMSGGDTGDETSFNPEIFNFQRIRTADNFASCNNCNFFSYIV